jgi:predicted amidohydrolase
MPFQLALVQMQVDGGRKVANLARAEQNIAEAAQHGAHVVLLPEAMTLGWTLPTSRAEADTIPDGLSCQRLCAAARRHQVYVCSGLIEKVEMVAATKSALPTPEQVYNAAVLIDPEGRVLLRHRKLNELEIGHACYDQGDRLNVVDTPLGRIGVLICADANTQGQVLTRALALMGADVILSPAAWAVPPDHDNAKEPYGATWRNCYTPVARDFRVWIAGVSNVGTVEGGAWNGWHCIGCSLVVAPGGREVLQGPYGKTADTILYVEITPEKRPARGTGWEAYWKKRET